MLPTWLLAAALVMATTFCAAVPKANASVLLCSSERDSGSLWSAVSESVSCPSHVPYPARLAMVNIFDSFWVASSGMPTCCNARGGPATFKDSVEALSLANASGVRSFRFFADLWGPNKKWYVENQEQYWKEFDAWFGVVEKFGLFVIPSLGNADWYKATSNETANDMVANSTSISRRLAVEYMRAFVSRYGNRNSVLMWELGNELNLHVNLPPNFCGGKQCFNTAQMIQYNKALVDAIREAEPRDRPPRPISSGYSAPRPTAWHQEHCPLSSKTNCKADPGTGYWSQDTLEQRLEMLQLQNTGVEVWSMHMYDNPLGTRNTSFLASASALAKNASAVIFVGEYGGHGPNFTGPASESRRFPSLVLDQQVKDAQQGGSFIISSVWAWACPSHRKDMVCIWPGQPDGEKESGTKPMLALLKNANKRLASNGVSRRSR